MRPLFNSFSNQIQTNGTTSAPAPQQVRPSNHNIQGNSMPNSAQLQPQMCVINNPQIANPFNHYNIHPSSNAMPNRPTSTQFFMNGPTQFPLQNGMSPFGSAPPGQPGQFFNGFGGPQNMSPMVMDQINNTCQPNSRLFAAHNSMNISPYFNQQHVSFPNGQACGQGPMYQFVQMQMPNYNNTQGHMPIMFQNQASQTVAPQNGTLHHQSATIAQFGPGNSNSIVQHGNQEQHMLLPPNSKVNGPNPTQQLQGKNKPNHTHNFRLGLVKSQGNPGKENGVNIPNTNWKNSPNKNFASHAKDDASHKGLMTSQLHQTQNANGKFKFHKERGEKAYNNGAKSGLAASNSQTQLEKKRCLPMKYTEDEIRQWREERKKNYPSKDNVDKKFTKREIADADAKLRRQQLKEILAKQAELGCEVAELPSDYLSDSANLMGGREDKKRAFVGNKGRPQNKFNKRGGRFCKKSNGFTKKQGPAATDHHDVKGEGDSNSNKKQRVGNSNLLSTNSNKRREARTLLQKLLGNDIRRDKAHLLQVFRFMVMNSYLKDYYPEKKQLLLLRFPHVLVKQVVEEEGCLVEDNVNVSKIKGNKVNNDDDKTEPRVSKETGTTSRIMEEEEGEIID